VAVASIITASQNWSSALTRFGCGALVLAGFDAAGFLPDQLSVFAFDEGNVGLGAIPTLVFWFLVSGVLGSVATMLGGIDMSGRNTEFEKAKRAYRVGITQNSLLAEYYQDASRKYDLASGLMGVIVILGISLLFGIVQLTFLEGSGVFSETDTSVGSRWRSILPGLFAVGTSFLVRRAATGGLDAVDRILAELDRQEDSE